MDKNMGTRREFLKKAAYTVPVITTMAAKPTFASSGSQYQELEATQQSPASDQKSKDKPALW